MVIVADRPGFLPVSAYLREPHEPGTWLIKDLLPISGACLIFGLPKSSKSWMSLQLACAIAGGEKEWMGFPVVTQGRVLMLQLDTPRSTWRLRYQGMIREGVKFRDDLLYVADRESLRYFPFDISREAPANHADYLQSLVRPLRPVAVVVDTLRKAHTKDENNSTDMSNVISKLVAAVHPAALILVSHSRKPSMEAGSDLMSDHRGSGSVTGEMDAIVKMTKKKMHFGGRNIEEGDMAIERIETKDPTVIIYKAQADATVVAMHAVLADQGLTSLRGKAKQMAVKTGRTEDACMSMLRRHLESDRHKLTLVAGRDVVDVTTGEVVR